MMRPSNGANDSPSAIQTMNSIGPASQNSAMIAADKGMRRVMVQRLRQRDAASIHTARNAAEAASHAMMSAPQPI